MKWLVKARYLLIIVTIAALFVIAFEYFTVDLKAPHPDGGYSVIDMSGPYGKIGEVLLSIHSIAIKTLAVSCIGVILLTYQIRNSY
ncbi:hypothetical protein [Sediminibacillus halophilus]|uniref:hypothetical protein n=1 Tax=Sediminibacillus halophilus TaxID=482461 RepID=UPI00111399F7|nr:hypothetical protein [Sediminibacillus halophilus]